MMFDTRILTLGIAALIGVFGIGMLIRGLRSVNRNVRSCPKCWYLLGGTTELRCPECGHLARSEHVVMRANRRRGSILLGLFFLIGSIYVVQQADRVRQVINLVPDRVLVMLLPYTSSDSLNNGIHEEVRTRARRGVLTGDAGAALLERIIAGDDSSEPGTLTWDMKYGQLARSLRAGLDEDDPLLKRFDAITPVVMVTAPAKWPPDVPLVVIMEVDRFDSAEQGTAVRITEDSHGEQTFTHNRRNRSRFPLAITMGKPGGKQRISISIDPPSGDADPHEQVLEVEVEPAPELMSALEARDEAAMRDLFTRSVFGFGVSFYEDGEPPWSLRFSPRSTMGGYFSEVLIGLEVDLLHRGTLLRRSLIWWHGDRGRAAWETVFEDRALLEGVAEDLEGWTLRITGRKEIALRALIGTEMPASSWFSGSFEIPFRIQLVPSTVLPREWERDVDDAHGEPPC